jgi:signal transduction histidine kinase/ligand-binding sensor domain-containing protein
VLRTVAVLLWALPGLALDPSLDISQYEHRAWTFREGFSNGAVNAFAQTADGYFWLGTDTGLMRFDGVRTAPLPLAADEQQLANVPIGSLLPARDGALWIGTLNGLLSWRNGKLTNYPPFRGRRVNALLEDRDKTVWAATALGGTGRLCAIRGGSTTCYGDDGSLGATVASLYEDQAGSLWVGTANGLWRWNPGPPTRYLQTRVLGRQALTQGDHGAGVIVGIESIRQISGTRVMDYPAHGLPSPFYTEAVFRDRDGGLWVGTQNRGLMHLYEGRVSLFTHKDGLSGDRVKYLFQDREGTIWAGTSEGFDRFRELPATSLSVEQGLSSATATSVLAARDGTIWIGTADGLNRWDHGRMMIYRRGEAIHSLYEDERGRIWIAGYRGLAVFENGKFSEVPSIPAGSKFAIAGDTNGGLWLSLWLTSNSDGVVHLVDGRIKEQVSAQKLGGGPVMDLAPEPDGGVWAGLWTGGVAYFRNGQIRKLTLSNDRAGAPRVEGLSGNGDGSFWASTENGLSRITQGRVATLSAANGLPCNTVHWIIEDGLSSYWMYTRCGLVRVARTELNGWAADPQRKIRMTTFDTTDGIRMVSALNGFKPPVTKSADGKIWFVNGETVSVIDPSRIAFNTLPPPVHIEQITADLKTYGARRGLQLPALVRDLTIDYTALSLAAPEKVHFRYKLEGQDSDWKEVVNKREAQYSNLPPGDYRFRVVASNNSGVWNDKGDVLDFSIPPAYYQTKWFPVLLAASFLGLLWAAYQFRIRQLERVRQLEADLAHINRVTTMGELAASIAHEVNQPLSGIVSNGSACLRWLAADKPDVNEIREAVGDMVRDGKRAGEVIARIRALTKRTAPPRERLDVNETIREVLSLVGDEAKRKNVVIRTQFADDLAAVSGDRVQLQQVILNLVMNAMDAMSSVVDRERQLAITTQNVDGEGRVQVTVKDTGTGMNAQTMARVFEAFYTTKPGGMGMGLSICRSIVQNHGGRLWAAANDGPGTSFHFTLPRDQQEDKHAGAAGL